MNIQKKTALMALTTMAFTSIISTSASVAATSIETTCDSSVTRDIFQAVKPLTGASLLSASASEISTAATLYKFTTNNGNIFDAPTTSATGLVPVYRLYNARSGDYMYTQSESEKVSAVNNYGYVVKKVEFYASPVKTESCSVPVYRYVKGSMHRSVASDSERAALALLGWRLEGLQFWVAPSVAPIVLTAPSQVDASILDETRIQLEWPDVEHAVSYQVWQSNGADQTMTSVNTSNAVTEALAGEGNSYSFTINPVSADGKVWPGTVSNSVVVGRVAAPANVNATEVEGNKVSVSWGNVNYAVSYEVTQTSSQGTKVIPVSGTSFTTDVLDAVGDTYHYTIAGVGTDGRIGISSPTSSVVVGTVSAPLNISSTVTTDNRVTTNWTAVPHAASYEVWEVSSNTPIATVTANSYTSSVLAANGSKYTYLVYAVGQDGRKSLAAKSATVTVGTARQAALHPFTATSPWNTAIGSNAKFDFGTSARTLSFQAATPIINRDPWSVSLRQATMSDPIVKLESTRNGKVFQARVPVNLVMTGGTDRHAIVIQPDGVTSYDIYKMEKVSDTHWRAAIVHMIDLRSSTGIGTGVRAAYTPGSAGLIRAHEVANKNIPHAVAISLPNSSLKSGYVWPAAHQDSDGGTMYTGAVPMGSLFAIPGTVNIDALPLSPEGKALAKALQNYGGYVVDRSGTAALYCERNCDPTATTRMSYDWKILSKHMRAVTNNTALAVGGGGTPRVAPAGNF